MTTSVGGREGGREGRREREEGGKEGGGERRRGVIVAEFPFIQCSVRSQLSNGTNYRTAPIIGRTVIQLYLEGMQNLSSFFKGK